LVGLKISTAAGLGNTLSEILPQTNKGKSCDFAVIRSLFRLFKEALKNFQ
jgi:hypothetical protein